MHPGQTRDQAARLAKTDTEAALEKAACIDESWYACQAYGCIARFAPEERVLVIVEQALRFGRRNRDAYKVVGAAAWPVRALVDRGLAEHLAPILAELLEAVGRIKNPVGRSEALFLLFQAVMPAGRQWWQGVFDRLLAESDPGVHWRQSRNLQLAIQMVAREDPALADELTKQVQNDRARAKAERALARKDYFPPRDFFRE